MVWQLAVHPLDNRRTADLNISYATVDIALLRFGSVVRQYSARTTDPSDLRLRSGPPKTLDKALLESQEILLKAGIEMKWLSCRPFIEHRQMLVPSLTNSTAALTTTLPLW